MSRQIAQLHIPRRASALALALLLTLVLLCPRADALSGTTGALRWTLSGGTLTVSGSGAMPDYTDATMPPWYDSAAAIHHVVVSDGITSVGSLAFYGCEAVRSVTLGADVAAIGDRAFKGCRAMTWLNLPEGLTAIGEAAFESCESLNGILLPESLRVIGNYAFDRCTALTAITIPAGVEDAGRVVFAYCTGLTRATIRCPIARVPDWYFYGCTALTALTLPDSVTTVGERTFEDCERLALVYYSGAAAEEIAAALHAEETTRYAEVVERGDSVPDATSTRFDTDSATAKTVTVTETDAALITKTTETKYTYTVNGADASLEEVLRSGEEDEVSATGESSTTVSATVSAESGWQAVADAAKGVSTDNSLAVEVQLNGSEVSGEALAEIAETDARLTVSTGSGSTWVIDGTAQAADSARKETYDLDFTVELLEKAPAKIESETVYELSFPSKTDFAATVGVPLKMSDAYHYATLYEKSTFSVTPRVTVQVDAGGRAWFPVDGVSGKKTYYVAIDAEGIDRSEAIIPDSLLSEYGAGDVEYIQTLTDASGKQYIVGERTSRWGITGRQYAIYAAVIIGGVVLIVTGVMITLNRINRSKARYAAMAAEDAAARADINEDELRLKVMQELLEETRRKNEADRQD